MFQFEGLQPEPKLNDMEVQRLSRMRELNPEMFGSDLSLWQSRISDIGQLEDMGMLNQVYDMASTYFKRKYLREP